MIDYIKNLGIPIGIYKGIKALIYSLFIFLEIDINVFNILFILIISDMATGIIKSIRLKELKFTFSRMWSGFLAKMVLISVPMLVALIGKAFQGDFDLFLSGTIKAIILTEGISVLTNLMSIYKEKHFDNPDYLYQLMKTIRRFFDDKFKKMLG